jgi:hypothetical protein
MEAVRLGRDFAKGDPEATLARFRKLSPGDQNMFRLGVARELKGIVEGVKDGANALSRIFGADGQRKRLRALFPDDTSFNAFEKAMKEELAMARSRQAVTGGSATGRIAAEQDDAGNLVNAAVDYAGGGVAGVLFGLGRRLISKTRGIGEASADELSKMLFDADKPTQQRIIAELVNRVRDVESRSGNNVKAITGLLSTAANVTSQQIAPYKR